MSKYENASLVQIPSGYKSGTLYSVLPANGDGDFDFTRASIATRVNSEGLIETVASGVPRLDYPILNGVVQSCPALLLEPARTNLVTHSDEFDDAAWTKSNATITADDAISPDGSQNADKLIDDSAAAVHYAQDTVSGLSVSTDYTFSVFVKVGEISQVRLLFAQSTSPFTNWARADFDLNTLSVFGTSEGTSSIEDYGSGWVRLSITGNSTTTGALLRISTMKNQTIAYSGSSEGIYLWGAQLEAGSYATSYIPTSGTTVARAAEVCQGASAEFNDSEGVLFAEVAAVSEAVAKRISISDGTTNEVVDLRVGTTLSCAVVVGGTAQATLSYSSATISDFNKIALKYKTDDFAFWVNGFEVGTDTSGSTPTGLDRMNFDRGTGTLNYYGKTKQLIAFDAALTDEQLEDLTSWDSFEELAASQFYTLY